MVVSGVVGELRVVGRRGDEVQIEEESIHRSLCECCGGESRTASGLVYDDDGHPTAAYFVHWTLGRVDSHGAMFDLIVGEWGESATSAGRSAVAVAIRIAPEGPSFMIVDATDRPVAESELVGHVLSRGEVVDTPLAQEVFRIVDAIWLHDSRIAEIVESAA